jgi:hypothetical protein
MHGLGHSGYEAFILLTLYLTLSSYSPLNWIVKPRPHKWRPTSVDVFEVFPKLLWASGMRQQEAWFLQIDHAGESQ